MPGTGARAKNYALNYNPSARGWPPTRTACVGAHPLCPARVPERMDFISYILRFFFSVFLNTAIHVKANITIKVRALAGI